MSIEQTTRVIGLVLNFTFAISFWMFARRIRQYVKSNPNELYDLFADAAWATALFFMAICLIILANIFRSQLAILFIPIAIYRLFVFVLLGYRLINVYRWRENDDN